MCVRLQLGNTDLPEQSPDLTNPESIPIELLQKLHHILLEVSPLRWTLRTQVRTPDQSRSLGPLISHSRLIDPGAGRCYGLPELQPHFPHQGGHPQHGQSQPAHATAFPPPARCRSPSAPFLLRAAPGRARDPQVDAYRGRTDCSRGGGTCCNTTRLARSRPQRRRERGHAGPPAASRPWRRRGLARWRGDLSDRVRAVCRWTGRASWPRPEVGLAEWRHGEGTVAGETASTDGGL